MPICTIKWIRVNHSSSGLPSQKEGRVGAAATGSTSVGVVGKIVAFVGGATGIKLVGNCSSNAERATNGSV